MKKIIAFLVLLILCQGCSLLERTPPPDKEEVPPPNISEVNKDGRVFYNPSDPSGGDNTGDQDTGVSRNDTGITPDTSRDVSGGEDASKEEGVHCFVSEVKRQTDTETIEERAIKNIKKEVTETDELEPQDMGDADYLHLKGLDIVSVSGDNLGFLEWIRIYIVNHNQDLMVAWGRSIPSSHRVSLSIDGSIDVLEFAANGATLKAKVLAESPSEDTTVRADLDLLKFSDCK